MSQTILQRIYDLADASSSEGADLYAALASIARKLASDDDAAAKAHTITGIVHKLAPTVQERVLAAAEALRAKA